MYISYDEHVYNLHVLHLSYIIHVHIYLSIDKADVLTERSEPVLVQMSTGRIVF